MKLTYRGVNYEFTQPTFESTEREIGGKYRGYPRHISVPQPVVDLTYRGVNYAISDPIDVEASRLRKQYLAKSVTATTEATPKLSNNRQDWEQLTSTHLANIRRNLENRLRVAKAKGDQNLIRLLEAEAKQIA